MKKYIFGSRNGIHIMNLEKRKDSGIAFLTSVTVRGGTVLFVGTKKQAGNRGTGRDVRSMHVTKRWLGGTLTNFPRSP